MQQRTDAFERRQVRQQNVKRIIRFVINRPTGLRPTFMHKFAKRGVEMSNDIFSGEPLPDRAELSRAAVQ